MNLVIEEQQKSRGVGRLRRSAAILAGVFGILMIAAAAFGVLGQSIVSTNNDVAGPQPEDQSLGSLAAEPEAPAAEQNTPDSQKLTNEQKQNQLKDRLATLFYDEGIDVAAEVVEVHSGFGFTAEGSDGQRLFVRWASAPQPVVGDQVSVNGIIKDKSEAGPTISGFVGDTEIFLRGQEVQIK